MRLRPCPDFLSRPSLAPAGYVAGVGRGATGFITRPDIGAGDLLADAAKSSVPIKGVHILGYDSKHNSRRQGDEHNDDGIARAAANEDEQQWLQKHATLNTRIQRAFSTPTAQGGEESEVEEEGMLGRGAWDRDDDEADAVYDRIDRVLSSRRTASKGLKDTAGGAGDVKGGQSSAALGGSEDLREQLATVTEEQWAALPDAGDFTRKRLLKRPRRADKLERYSAVPDSVLFGSHPGAALPVAAEGAEDVVDFGSIRLAKERVLSGHLDTLAIPQRTSGQDDPSATQAYLSELPTAYEKTAELGRARQLLTSITQGNPASTSAWLARARLEATASHPKRAIAILLEGLAKADDNEAIWAELLGLDPRAFASDACKACPGNASFWLALLHSERIPSERIKLLRRALQHSRTSIVLWRQLVHEISVPEKKDEEEDTVVAATQEQQRYLEMAVQCCNPVEAVDLWLALAASYESVDEEEAVLERAIAAIGVSDAGGGAALRALFIRLATIHSTVESIERIVGRMVDAVGSSDAGWMMQEARSCEDRPLIAEAIVRRIPQVSLVDIDSRYPRCTQLVLARLLLSTAPQSTDDGSADRMAIWMAAVEAESNPHARADLLRRALADSSIREEQQQGDRLLILCKALVDADPSCYEEAIAVCRDARLAVYHVVKHVGLSDAGSSLLNAAASDNSCYTHGELAAIKLVELQIAAQASSGLALSVEQMLSRYVDCERLWILSLLASPSDAASSMGDKQVVLEGAVKACPRSALLHTLLIRALVLAAPSDKGKQTTRARAVIEQARMKNADDDRFWIASLDFEATTTGATAVPNKMVEAVLARAPQTSGRVARWRIAHTPRALRRSAATAALSRLQVLCMQSASAAKNYLAHPSVVAGGGGGLGQTVSMMHVHAEIARILAIDEGRQPEAEAYFVTHVIEPLDKAIITDDHSANGDAKKTAFAQALDVLVEWHCIRVKAAAQTTLDLLPFALRWFDALTVAASKPATTIGAQPRRTKGDAHSRQMHGSSTAWDEILWQQSDAYRRIRYGPDLLDAAATKEAISRSWAWSEREAIERLLSCPL